MISARLTQLAAWCDAQLLGEDARFEGVSVDSRKLLPGQLFVALPGERVDGLQFVAAAKLAGAAGALLQAAQSVDLPQVVCADPQLALGRIARHWLEQNPAVRIGITGSNGKTTVKTLTASVLAQAGRTYANPGNRNNEIGLPLAACELSPEDRFAVFEMGAGKPGDIEYLCGIAPPQIALVNNVAAAHLERLGSVQGVADTKGAIYQALPAEGVAIIPADDGFAGQFRAMAGSRRQLSFGFSSAADVSASAIEPGLQASRFVLHIGAERQPVELPLAGAHNVRNALAAAAIGHAAGLSCQQIVAGLEQAPAVAGRLNRITDPRGFVLIDDSYNANPGSFAAGLRTVTQGGGRIWVAMGQMAELGPEGPQLHAELGQLARELGVERLYAVGELCRAAVAAAGSIARHFTDLPALIACLGAELQPGVTLLVKGSRSAGMERVIAALRAPAAVTAGANVC